MYLVYLYGFIFLIYLKTKLVNKNFIFIQVISYQNFDPGWKWTRSENFATQTISFLSEWMFLYMVKIKFHFSNQTEFLSMI